MQLLGVTNALEQGAVERAVSTDQALLAGHVIDARGDRVGIGAGRGLGRTGAILPRRQAHLLEVALELARPNDHASEDRGAPGLDHPRERRAGGAERDPATLLL